MEPRSLSREQAKALFQQVQDHEERLDSLVEEFRVADSRERSELLAAFPELQEELEYQAAQTSIVEARRAAVRDCGNIMLSGY
jgi:uncharacterized membrane-anchored protein